ncbi:MAG: hypothetical protein V4702_02420 [Patescibacteria group bacterium]
MPNVEAPGTSVSPVGTPESSVTPASAVAAEVLGAGLTHEELLRFSASQVDPNALRRERSPLEEWRSSVAIGYVALGEGYDDLFHDVAFPRILVEFKNWDPAWAVHGRVHTERTSIGPLSGGGSSEEVIHAVLDEDWAEGEIYRQAAVLRAKAEHKGTVLEELSNCLLVFELDEDTPGPLGHMDHIKGQGEWRLAGVLADTDINHWDAYFQLLDLPPEDLLSQIDPDEVPPMEEGWLKAAGLRFAEEFAEDFKDKDRYRKIVDTLMETFHDMHVAGDFRFDNAAHYVTAKKRNINAAVLKLIEIYRFHSVTPADWSIPCRGYNAMLTEDRKEAAIKADYKHKPAEDDEAKQASRAQLDHELARIENRRDNIRRAVMQALGYGHHVEQSKGYVQAIEDIKNVRIPNPMRAFLRGMDPFDIEFFRDLYDAEDPTKTLHDEAYEMDASGVSIKYSKLPFDVRFIMEATQGNELFRRISMNETDPDKAGIKGTVVYRDGDVMPHSAPHGYYIEELLQSFWNPHKENMMFGLAAHVEVTSKHGDMRKRKFLIVDALAAPGRLLRVLNEGMNYFETQPAALPYHPTLVEMLTEQPLQRRFAPTRIQRVNSRSGPKIHTKVKDSIAEGDGVLFVRTADGQSVRVHRTIATRSDIAAKKNKLGYDKATLKGLEGQYEPTGEPLSESEVALSGVLLHGHKVLSWRSGQQPDSETKVARNIGRPVKRNNLPEQLGLGS